MRDRSEQILRYAGVLLAALVLASLLRAGCRAGALVGAKIPAVPALETNAVAGAHAPAPPPSAHGPVPVMDTNASANRITSATNYVSPKVIAPGSTNIARQAETNSPEQSIAATNIARLLPPSSSSSSSNSNSNSNSLASATNLAATNITTNATKKSRHRPPSTLPGGMEFGGFPGMPGMPGKAPKLPPEIQTRVDKIVDSELFAPVIHPQPMALLGIAGDTAFLRTAGGQTGLVKAGEPLGDLKLLRIGINRVLVEQDGQKKELLIFDGFGGESLLPNDSKDNSQ